MVDDLALNVQLLRRRVPNLTAAARAVGLRAATVSDLCNGKIPVGRAQVRTLVALASLAGCQLDDLILHTGTATMVETGIKALDLFAPLVKIGAAGAVSRQGLGQLVLVTELMHRLRTQYDYLTLLWLPTVPLPSANEVITCASAVGETTADVREAALNTRAEHDVLVVADRETVLSGELLSLRQQLEVDDASRVTFVLFDLRGETPDVEGAPYGPLDTLWRIDPDLAARRLYPAIDPISSASVLVENARLETRHLEIAQRARSLLRRYRELRTVTAVHGLERLPIIERATFRRGERLEAFLTQPLFVAEQHTGRAGQWVPLADTLDGVRHLLDGATDDMEVEALSYIGPLPPMR